MERFNRFAEKAAGPIVLVGAVLLAAALSALVPSPEEREGAAGTSQPVEPAQPEKVNPNTTSYPDGYTPTGPVVGSTAERR